MKYIISILFLFSSNSILRAEDSRPYLVLKGRPTGMFSNFYDILIGLSNYEYGLYSGIEIFLERGLYYDKNYGENWWEYYFEPIKIEYPPLTCEIYGIDETIFYSSETAETRRKRHNLIKKYIHVKPFILEQVDQFQKENFEGAFVISIHYRGTDKHKEAPRVPYENVVEQIDRVISENSSLNHRIFVATDEQQFLDYMIEKYGKMVCFIEARRSLDGYPIHSFNNSDPYQQGLETVKDAILLSRGDYLIRTSSNVSLFSCWLNPDLKVYELSRRY